MKLFRGRNTQLILSTVLFSLTSVTSSPNEFFSIFRSIQLNTMPRIYCIPEPFVLTELVKELRVPGNVSTYFKCVVPKFEEIAMVNKVASEYKISVLK